MLHLHLGHHQLDVVFLVGQVGDNALFRVLDLCSHVLDDLHLILGRVLAVSDVLVEGLDDCIHLLDTGDNVFVVARHEAFHSVGHALSESILITDARGEVVKVVLSREANNETSGDASELLTSMIWPVWHGWPVLVTNVATLHREQAENKSFTCLFELTSLVHLHDLAIGSVSVHAKAHGLDMLEASVLGNPVVRSYQQVQ